MRLICFLAAIAVLFCLSDASAQTARAATWTSADSSQAPSAQAAGLRLLTWPGKVEPPQGGRARGPAARTPTAHSFSGMAPRSADARPQAVAAPPPADRRIWDPTTGQVPAPQAAALPTNIYTPAPPRMAAAAPVQPAQPRTVVQAANDTSDYQPTHFYSLHRQYGQTPDPIPLDAQFFAGSSPDLAQPPPPVPRTVTTTGGRVVQAPPPSPDDVPG
jgi:hypothetical protein